MRKPQRIARLTFRGAANPERKVHGSRALRVVCLCAALQTAAAAAAPPAPADLPARPRIGLVLGGGGAKGGAHIGVIKVLEEMRIPVDCIAGTSMGAIVGAAYSTGLSAQQLEKVVGSVNWGRHPAEWRLAPRFR